MTIRVTCQHCGAALKIKDELAGTEGHCPKCKHKFRIPALVLAGSTETKTAEEAPLTQPDTALTQAASPSLASAPLPPSPQPETAAASNADDDLDCEPALLWKPDPEPETKSAPVQASVSRPTLPLAEPEPEKPPEKPAPVVPVAADPEDSEVETIPLARVEEPVRPAAKATTPVDDELEEAPRLALPAEENTTSGPLSDDELDSGPLLALSEDDNEAPSSVRPPVASTRSPEQAPPSEKPKVKSKTSGRSGAKDDFDPADFLSRGPSPNKRPSPSSSELLTVDSAEWEAERPSREPTKKAAKSGATSAAASEVWDHAKAARQMQRALKESVQAEQQRKPEAEEAFDWVGLFREFGLKGLGGLAVCVLLAYGVYYLVDKMMGGGVPLPEIGYVSGVVTLDGNPLPGATVYFMPVEPKYPNGKKGTARTSVGITDQQGRYTLLYIDKIQGVATGNCLVWLDLMGPDGKQVIPPNYLQAAMQMREVKPGRQTIDFNLQSVTTQPKK